MDESHIKGQGPASFWNVKRIVSVGVICGIITAETACECVNASCSKRTEESGELTPTKLIEQQCCSPGAPHKIEIERCRKRSLCHVVKLNQDVSYIPERAADAGGGGSRPEGGHS